MKLIKSGTLILIVAFFSSFVFPAMAQESYQINQCAVLQTGKKPRIYLTTPAGELEAVDVNTGKVMWRSKNISFAFLARGKRLLAALAPIVKGKTGCGLIILDSGTGKILHELTSQESEFMGCVEGALNASMSLESVRWNDRDFLVRTRSWRPMSGGVNREYKYPPGSFGADKKTYEVDLDNSRITPLAENIPDGELKMITNPSGGYHSETFTAGGITAQAALEMTDNRFHMTLRRWKGAEALPEVRLPDPESNGCGIVVSADRQDVLGIFQVPGKASPFSYHVNLYSAAGGEKLAGFETTGWPADFQLCGNKLAAFYPFRVFVVDIRTGREIWSKPVRDMAYRGPTPP
jgi:hypothetical protein